jgi:hypothetical protein
VRRKIHTTSMNCTQLHGEVSRRLRTWFTEVIHVKLVVQL